MRHKAPEIVMSFASLGSYRLNTMRALKEHFGKNLLIISGNKAPDPSIKLIPKHELDHTQVSNYIGPGALVLQKVPIKTLISCSTLVIDLNPRMPLNWLLLVIRKGMGRRTLLWGHAFPRLGRQSPTEKLRAAMRRLASGLIAYTHSQAQELGRLHTDVPVWAAPNALYFRSQFGFDMAAVRDSFIYVGRLHGDKKPLLLVEAFERLLREHEEARSLHLSVVGSGPLEPELAERAAASDFSENIVLSGHVEDYEVLRKMYARAIASVSPGYVGLSVTQSLSFGVPMIISRNEPHAPELEAVWEGRNGEFFETDDIDSLKGMMLKFFQAREEWRSRGCEIAARSSDVYSVEAMVGGLVSAIEGISK